MIPKAAPAAGALVGLRGFRGDLVDTADHVFFFGAKKNQPMVADKGGRVSVSASQFFSTTGPRSRFLYLGTAPLLVLDESRGLIAYEELRLSDFDGGTRQIHLQPACRVIGAISSVGLWQQGRSLTETSASAFWPGRLTLRAVFCQASRPPFELLLPPGEYGICIDSVDCERTYRYLRITTGQRECKLQVDLPPHLAPESLIGQPAPEFRQIKAWKNGGPLKLADLRGKVVVLDFFGYWCGPCMVSMPHLMSLYDKYESRGLVVIAVHDDSVESVEELDRKLERPRRELWGGREPPFPIALAGGGAIRIRGTGQYTSGATPAAYRVTAYPTTLIIDGEGNVAGTVELLSNNGRTEAAALIERLLGTPSRRQR